MNDKRIRARLKVTEDELRHDGRFRRIQYALQGSKPLIYCVTMHDIAMCDPATVEASSIAMAVRMAKARLKEQRERSWLYTRPRAIRAWWLDHVWPFRKEYPLRVSSHPVAMFLRRRAPRLHRLVKDW